MSEQEQEFKMVEGVRNIHVVQIDTKEMKFLTPQRVRGLGEIKVTRTFKEGSAIGDMEVMISKKKLKQLDIAITANELPPRIESLMEGKTYENGELYSTENDDQNPVALLWEEVWSDGSSSYNAVYNAKMARDGREGKGNSDNLDFQTVSLTGVGLKSEIAGAFDLVLFDDDPNVDKDKIANFFKAVQIPKVAAVIPNTISVDYAGYTSGEITEISLAGVTFNADTKQFLNVQESATTFTFKLDGVNVTATLSGNTWSFAKDVPQTIEVEYSEYESGEITDISLESVTFDTSTKKFKKVPIGTTTFTFKKDSTDVTATLSDGTWTFV